MTKAQEQDRLDRIDEIGKRIRRLMEDYSFESDKALDHLERAKAHIAEAWIAADGQNARSVAELVTQIDQTVTLFKAVAEAASGTKFKIGGKTFVKQPEVIL